MFRGETVTMSVEEAEDGGREEDLKGSANFRLSTRAP